MKTINIHLWRIKNKCLNKMKFKYEDIVPKKILLRKFEGFL